MNKNSILIIQPWLNYRGAETLSIQLGEDLVKDGLEAKILCLFVTEAVAGHINRDLLILPPIGFQKACQNRLFFSLFGFWLLTFYAIKYGSGFEWYNPHNFPSAWSAGVAKIVWKKKIVWTVHNFPQHPFRGLTGWLFEMIIRPLDLFFVRQCDYIFAVSKKVKQQIKEKYGLSAKVVYPGIDLDFFARTNESVSDERVNGKKIILQVGQMRSEKKPQFSVDVLTALAERIPELVLVLIGEGDFSKLKINERVKARVFYLGKMKKESLVSWYRRADLLIYPSGWGEGCTLVPMEAMASGVKNIAVVSGCGVDELLDSGTGIVFSEDASASEVADQIARYFQQIEKRNFWQIISRYDRKTFAKNYELLFQQN